MKWTTGERAAKTAVLTLERAGWTTARIAARLDVSESAVRTWRDYGVTPNRATREKLMALAGRTAR